MRQSSKEPVFADDVRKSSKETDKRPSGDSNGILPMVVEAKKEESLVLTADEVMVLMEQNGSILQEVVKLRSLACDRCASKTRPSGVSITTSITTMSEH